MLPYLTKTFLERGDGFHFSGKTPPEIAELRFLKSSNPWEVLACVLANLQKGNFEVASVPIDLMMRNDDVNLWIACAHLLGYAAPIEIVKLLFEQFSDPIHDSRKRYLCTAGVDAGILWSVDKILDLYSRSKNANERSYFEFELSWLLEEDDGKLWAGAELFEASDPDRPPYLESDLTLHLESYVKLVRERVEVLSRSTDFKKMPIAEGKLIDIQEVAKTLLARLKLGDGSYRIDRGRMLLEATTGLDCNGFFNDRYILQPLAAARVIETFLESDSGSKYKPGFRYFFGHIIPECPV